MRLKLGVFMLAGIVILAFTGPSLSPYSYEQMDESSITNGQSSHHWLGTDALGRDYMARLLKAGQLSLCFAFLGSLIPLFIAINIALISSFYRGWVDIVLMRMAEVVQALPFLPIAISINAFLAYFYESQQRLYLALFIIAIISWPKTAMSLRSLLIKLRESEMIQSARCLGLSPLHLMKYYYWPMIRPFVLIQWADLFSRALLAETALSFLSLGVVDPLVSWGSLLSMSRQFSYFYLQPYQWSSAAVMITLTVFSINLIIDALNKKFAEVYHD